MHSDPQLTINQLSAVAHGIIDLHSHLAEYGAAMRGSKAKYSFASQSWMAQKLGVSLRTINRVVRRLKHLGVFDVIHRRKRLGHFRTCLYILKKWPAWGAQRVRAALRLAHDRAPKVAHIAPLRRETDIKESGPRPSEEERDKMVALLSELGARFKPTPS
jgi:hypothetical protein